MRLTAGRVLEEIVADIYLMGAKPVGEYEAERVEACIKDLQLDRCAALARVGSCTCSPLLWISILMLGLVNDMLAQANAGSFVHLHELAVVLVQTD